MQSRTRRRGRSGRRDRPGASELNTPVRSDVPRSGGNLKNWPSLGGPCRAVGGASEYGSPIAAALPGLLGLLGHVLGRDVLPLRHPVEEVRQSAGGHGAVRPPQPGRPSSPGSPDRGSSSRIRVRSRCSFRRPPRPEIACPWPAGRPRTTSRCSSCAIASYSRARSARRARAPAGEIKDRWPLPWRSPRARREREPSRT